MNFPPARSHLIAVLSALTAFLFARSWLQVSLRDSGLDKLHAADLSYLVFWPALLVLLLPVLRASRDQLRRFFDLSAPNLQLVLSAIAIGLLIRLAWWSQVIAGISFGLYSGDNVNAIVGPHFAFKCPPWNEVALGILVMAILVPITEELICRGFIQSALYRFGPQVAIIGSAAVFTLFHKPDSWDFVFVAGVVFGIQFWITKSLWASVLTHSTINGLIQLDWRCLRGQWNPASSDLPLAIPGTMSALLFAVCLTTILTLLWKMHRGDTSPR